MENLIEKTSKYHYVEAFGSNGCVIVAMDEYMGLVDKQGNVIIPLTEYFSTILDRYILADLCLYDSVGKFLTKVDRGAANAGSVGDYLFYRINGDLFLMDNSNLIIPVHTSLKYYNFFAYLGNGLFTIYMKNTKIDYGIMTINKLVVPCIYESIRRKDGQIIIENQYEVYTFDPISLELSFLRKKCQESFDGQNVVEDKGNIYKSIALIFVFIALAICCFYVFLHFV